MKVLYVTGDEYSAMDVSDTYGISKAVKLAKDNGGKAIIDDGENIYAEVSIIEFGEVDPAFVRFINAEMIDYDASKSTDFFVIEEDE